jgi:hypothetical protein
MNNKKGLSLIVTIAIIMILSVVALTVLFVVFKDNFNIFKKETKNILDTTEGLSAKNACKLACEGENSFIYCCKEFEVLGEKYKCGSDDLKVNCELDCEGFECTENAGTTGLDPSGVGG